MTRIASIRASFRRLPVWVQVWVAMILVPVNLASLWFLHLPHGPAIAILAVGGMVPNIWIMWHERGLSKAMALPHVLIWTPMMALVVVFVLRDDVRAIDAYLVVLVAVDLISLGFDYSDAWKWLLGDRKIA